MMAYSDFYPQFFRNRNQGLINLEGDLRIMLLDGDYVPQLYQSAYIDIVNEISGAGYTARGQAVPMVQQNIGPDILNTYNRIYGGPVSWKGVDLSFRFAVLYDNTPAEDQDKKLIGWIDFGEVQTITGDFSLVWDTQMIYENAEGQGVQPTYSQG